MRIKVKVKVRICLIGSGRISGEVRCCGLGMFPVFLFQDPSGWSRCLAMMMVILTIAG